MVFYFVQRGETLYTIAKRYQTTVHAIVVANRLEDPNAICPGQALVIPRPGEVPSPPPGGIVHLIRPGETIFQLATKFRTTPQEILQANQIAHPEFVLPGQQLVIPERMEAGDDWPMLGRTPGRSGASPVQLSGPPADGWSVAPAHARGFRPSAPVVRYDRVYVGLGDGQFHCLCRHTGRLKWQVPACADQVLTPGDMTLPTPAVFDGLAYLAGPDGAAFAVDAYTGQHIWRTVTGGPITSALTAGGGMVYLGSQDEHLYALEAKTGAIAWKRHVGLPLTDPVAVGDDHLFVVGAEGALMALDLESGEPLWITEQAGSGVPVFAEVVVLLGGRAYDPRTGQMLWEVDAREATPVPRLDQVIYPGGCVDLFTGIPVQPPVAEVRSAPLVEEAAAVSLPPGNYVIPPPPVQVRATVLAGGLLIGVGEDQRLHAWNATTGNLAWRYALPAPGEHAPAVAAGQLVITLADGSVRSCRFD